MSTIFESLKLFVLIIIICFEWLIRKCVTLFYRLFPFPGILHFLYQRLKILRVAFSEKLSGPTEIPEFKYSFRDLVLANGYDIEEHYATTPDGFCLVLHRVLPPSSRPVHSVPETLICGTDNSKLLLESVSCRGAAQCNSYFPCTPGVECCSHLQEKTGDNPSINDSSGPSVVSVPARQAASVPEPVTAEHVTFGRRRGSGESRRDSECTSSNAAAAAAAALGFCEGLNQAGRLLDKLSPTKYFAKESCWSNFPNRSSRCTRMATTSTSSRMVVDVAAAAGLTGHCSGCSCLAPSTSSSSSSSSASQASRRPIFLMHGLMMCSEIFVFDKSVSLAFLLVDAGYDVWLGNNRGNKYSWVHSTYKRNNEQYWDFSIDEFSRFDVPTSVDYILNATGFESLSYLGFSNGASQMFAALSTNAPLNHVIDLFIALSPACKLKSILNPQAECMSLFYPLVTSSRLMFNRIFGKKGMLTVAETWKNILSIDFYTRILDTAIYFLFSWKLKNVDEKMKQIFYSHLYSTTSTKVVHHWCQMLRSGSFQFYDDSVGGLSDSICIPEYRLEKIHVPVALLCGKDDKLSDFTWMREKLMNVGIWEIESYEHVDSLVARDVPEKIFPIILDLLGRLYKPPPLLNQQQHSSLNKSSLSSQCCALSVASNESSLSIRKRQSLNTSQKRLDSSAFAAAIESECRRGVTQAVAAATAATAAAAGCDSSSECCNQERPAVAGRRKRGRNSSCCNSNPHRSCCSCARTLLGAANCHMRHRKLLRRETGMVADSRFTDDDYNQNSNRVTKLMTKGSSGISSPETHRCWNSCIAPTAAAVVSAAVAAAAAVSREKENRIKEIKEDFISNSKTCISSSSSSEEAAAAASIQLWEFGGELSGQISNQRFNKATYNSCLSTTAGAAGTAGAVGEEEVKTVLLSKSKHGKPVEGFTSCCGSNSLSNAAAAADADDDSDESRSMIDAKDYNDDDDNYGHDDNDDDSVNNQQNAFSDHSDSSLCFISGCSTVPAVSGPTDSVPPTDGPVATFKSFLIYLAVVLIYCFIGPTLKSQFSGAEICPKLGNHLKADYRI